jgi:hypothetical protein
MDLVIMVTVVDMDKSPSEEEVEDMVMVVFIYHQLMIFF